MKIIVVLLAGAMFVFSSCSTDNSFDQLRAVNKSLESSNAFIAQGTSYAHEAMQRLRADPAYASDAKHYLRKVDSITRKSTELVKFMKSLKVSLGDLEKDKEVVQEIFITNKKGSELYTKISNYIDHMREQFSDEEAEEAYEHGLNDINILGDFLVPDSDMSNMWVKLHLEDASVLSAKTLLSTLQNEVLTLERRLVNFCKLKVSGREHDMYGEVFAPLVAMSSSQVKAGDEIEITAGLGVFSRMSKPEITINGAKVSVGEQGVGIFNLKASKRAGEYVVPVLIKYTDMDGSTKEVKREVRYRVVE